MKIQVTFKDPDSLNDCIAMGVRENFVGSDLSDDEAGAVIEKREEAVRELAKKWFKYGEYITVEIDTEAKTCVVVEEKE